MVIFDSCFSVDAPVERVAAFHLDVGGLRRVTPFPVIIQPRRSQPITEGAISQFVMWFGPVPTRWSVLHTQVNFRRGFTDRQLEGPLKSWSHTHRFAAQGEVTLVSDHVELETQSGLRGALTGEIFSRPMMRILFLYRGWITRRSLAKRDFICQSADKGKQR